MVNLRALSLLWKHLFHKISISISTVTGTEIPHKYKRKKNREIQLNSINTSITKRFYKQMKSYYQITKILNGISDLICARGITWAQIIVLLI